jgi:WS/DGAT/MGAT family acyltransferase
VDSSAHPRRLERLSPLDVSTLRVEDRGLPMHVAALAILEGAPLPDANGQPRLDLLREHLQRRLQLAPRLRQVLLRPPVGLGPPLWVDDAGFDLRQHVGARAVPAPADEPALLKACTELNEPPLDRSRPLWELWLLTGLTGGNVGMLIRLHHVVADGIAGVALFGSMFDLVADAPSPVAAPWIPAPIPSRWELLTDNLRRQRAALTGALSRLGHPVRALRRLRSTAGQVGGLLREGLAPRTSLNRAVGKHRRLLLVRADLEAARQVAHAHEATVNDVVLAAVAGGARELLRSRGELAPGLRLRVMVPVSMRGAGGLGASGNRVGVVVVGLPVAEPNPVRRLEQLSRATAARRRRPPYQPGARLTQHGVVWVMVHQRLVNLFTSNVPGPPVPLYVAGARLLELSQIGVIQGNVTLSVGVLSYAGRLNFDILGDPDACPDLAVFAAGLRGALQELGVGVPMLRASSLPPVTGAAPAGPFRARSTPPRRRGRRRRRPRSSPANL